MIWIIIPFVIGMAILIHAVRQEAKAVYGEPWFATIIGGMMVVFITVLVGMVCNFIASNFVDGTQYEDERHALLSLKDNSTTSGSFFLGSGSFEEEPSFFYYQQTGRGATLEHVDADRAVIVEEDIDSPYLSVLIGGSENDFWYIGSLDKTYEFHVPVGSITNRFELDAE